MAQFPKPIEHTVTVSATPSEIKGLLIENARLRYAIAESVKLQSHYAGLLNDYDGGKRMKFPDVQAWLDRLAATGKA